MSAWFAYPLPEQKPSIVLYFHSRTDVLLTLHLHIINRSHIISQRLRSPIQLPMTRQPAINSGIYIHWHHTDSLSPSCAAPRLVMYCSRDSEPGDIWVIASSLKLTSCVPAGLTACQQLTSLEIFDDAASSPVLGKLSSLRCLILTVIDQEPHRPYYAKLTALTELFLSLDTEAPTAIRNMTGLRTLRWVFVFCYILCSRHEFSKFFKATSL